MNVMEYYEDMNYCPTCKKAKAIKIIKNKYVSIRWVVGDKPTIESELALSEKEYEILKEVFSL